MATKMKRNPFYRLYVHYQVGSSSSGRTYKLRNLTDLKNLLLYGLSDINNIVQIQFYKEYVLYQDYDVVLLSEDCRTLLNDIEVARYRIQIGINSLNWEGFEFYSLREVKDFLRKYESFLGSLEIKYYVIKYTRYFDKDDDYRVKVRTETLTDDL